MSKLINETEYIDPLQLDLDRLDVMYAAGVAPELIYATKKTDHFVLLSNVDELTPAEREELENAVKESRRQIKKFARPKKDSEMDDWRTWVVTEAVLAAELILLAAAAGDGDEATSLSLEYARLVQQKAAVVVRNLSPVISRNPATKLQPIT
jgi:hypothetical protein